MNLGHLDMQCVVLTLSLRIKILCILLDREP